MAAKEAGIEGKKIEAVAEYFDHTEQVWYRSGDIVDAANLSGYLKMLVETGQVKLV